MLEPDETTAGQTGVVAATPVQGIAALRENIRAGLRLACLLKPYPETLHFSWGQLLTLLALNFSLGFAAQVAYIGIDGRFQLGALPGALLIVPELTLAWLLACIGRDSAGAGRYLIGLFALAIPVNLANLLLFFLQPTLTEFLNPWVQWLLAYCPLLWYGVAAALGGVRLFNLSGIRALAAIVAVFAMLWVSQSIVDNDRWLWVAQPDRDDTAAPEKDYFASVREDHIYRQQALLSEALAKLKPGQAGKTELFLVAAAGYATQDVFMKEVNSVVQLFDERFGTQGHSLRLINNTATMDEVPMASKTALQQALQRVASLMNENEDILFLFMTSHGSKDHKFSLDFGMLRFNDITPDVLRKLLDDSGIKRRVIVISACYSGGFVDALKGDDTLVITAAAADKNSFGCSNENDYTYFGKAYFDEALRKTTSFVEAFEMAKPLIAERERKEEETPSEPQISLGKEIAPVLEVFAKERSRASAEK